jgi:hypothetical protein
MPVASARRTAVIVDDQRDRRGNIEGLAEPEQAPQNQEVLE